jgi:hypothetical protein
VAGGAAGHLEKLDDVVASASSLVKGELDLVQRPTLAGDERHGSPGAAGARDAANGRPWTVIDESGGGRGG